MPKRALPLSEEQIKEIKRLYLDEELSIDSINKKINISENRITKLLDILGIRRTGKKLFDMRLKKKGELVDYNQIFEEYSKGFSIKQISEKLNCCREVISNFLELKGLVPNKHIEKNLTEKDILEIKNLYINDKVSILDISKKLNFPFSYVDKIIKDSKLQRTRKEVAQIVLMKRGLKPLNKDEVIRLCHDGFHPSEIAKELNCSPSTVGKYLNSLGFSFEKAFKIKFDVDLLKDLYVNQKKSTNEIGKILNIEPVTIVRRLRKLGWLRTMKEAVSLKHSQNRENGLYKGYKRDGYVFVSIPPDHKFACIALKSKRGYWPVIREHRLVMSEHLGRPLERCEQVHHINYDRSDNRIENLIILGAAEHSAETQSHTAFKKMRKENERLKKKVNKLTYQNNKLKKVQKEAEALEFLP